MLDMLQVTLVDGVEESEGVRAMQRDWSQTEPSDKSSFPWDKSSFSWNLLPPRMLQSDASESETRRWIEELTRTIISASFTPKH